MGQRILLVERSETGHVGGSLTGLLHLIRGIDQSRFDPSLLVYEPKDVAGTLAGTDCPVIVLTGVPKASGPVPDRKPDRRTGPWAVMRRSVGAVRHFVNHALPRAKLLEDAFREARPALVHLGNGIKPNVDGVVAARRLGIPCIAHEKGLVRYTPFDRLWAKRVGASVSMTEAIRQHLIAQGVQAPRMVVAPDGLDLSHHKPSRPRDETRASLGIAPSDLVVGMTVNVQPWKGQEVLLRALHRLEREGLKPVCVLAGGVVRGAEWYQQQLEDFVRAKGMVGRVKFLGSRRDIPDLQHAFDVQVHASVTPEPFGRVLIEAMALERPLVASNAGGVPEIVVDGETGFLITPEDDAAMAVGLGKLLRDRTLRERMGAAGRARAESHFSGRAAARRFEQVYDDVLGN